MDIRYLSFYNAPLKNTLNDMSLVGLIMVLIMNRLKTVNNMRSTQAEIAKLPENIHSMTSKGTNM